MVTYADIIDGRRSLMADGRTVDRVVVTEETYNMLTEKTEVASDDSDIEDIPGIDLDRDGRMGAIDVYVGSENKVVAEGGTEVSLDV